MPTFEAPLSPEMIEQFAKNSMQSLNIANMPGGLHGTAMAQRYEDYMRQQADAAFSISDYAQQAQRNDRAVEHMSLFYGMLVKRPRTTAVRMHENGNARTVTFTGVAEHGEFAFKMPLQAVVAVCGPVLKDGDTIQADLWMEGGVCIPPKASIELVGVTLYRDIPITRDEGKSWETQDVAEFHLARNENGMQLPAVKINLLMKHFPSDLLPVQIAALL